jgi:predicted metal-dependent peptidase
MTRHLTAEQKLVRARTQLLLNHPFFGTLCVRLKLVPGSLPTMATNGRRIVYNPAYVAELKPAELEGVLAHEVLHCALAHHCRRGQRDPELWNEAADYAVNPILLAGGVTLPAGVLSNAAFADLSAEEIYEQLRRPREQDNSAEGAGGSGGASQQPPLPPQDKPVSSPASGQRPSAIGEVTDAVDEDGVAPSQAEKARQEREWAIASEQALRAAKACGCEPSGVERAIERKRESEVDWRAVLRDFVAASRPADYSWTPPNRRHLGRGLYIPSIVRASAGELVIAVDTSGSIGADEIEQFAGEISAIAEDVQPDSIRVVYCDAAMLRCRRTRSLSQAMPLFFLQREAAERISGRYLPGWTNRAWRPHV